MTCDEVADFIDAIAAGDLVADAAVGAHLSTCPACAQTLDVARRLEQLLQLRAAQAPPPQFTSRLLHRLRRASWRREQIVDWIFNSAMIAAALLVVAGLWIALRQTGMSAVSRDAIAAFGAGMTAAAQKVTPSLPLYAGATCVLVGALGVWWWASDSAAL